MEPKLETVGRKAFFFLTLYACVEYEKLLLQFGVGILVWVGCVIAIQQLFKDGQTLVVLFLL